MSEFKLNPDMYLNSHFLSQPEKEANRLGFGHGLLEVAKTNEQVVGLCCDLTGSITMNFFADEFPDRFFQIGVAEQNMAGIGSGLALMGKIPFIGSYAAFSPGRNFDQIRVSIA